MKFYNTFGEALDMLLKSNSLSRKWLAEKIKSNDVKLQSMQSQISRWIRGEPVSEIYRLKINSILDTKITQSSNGKWIIDDAAHSRSSQNELKAIDAGQVVLPESGKLSRDQMRELLGQIESIVRIMKDSL